MERDSYVIRLVDGEREIPESALILSATLKSYSNFASSQNKTLDFLNNDYPNFNLDCLLVDRYLKWADIHLTYPQLKRLGNISSEEIKFFLSLTKDELFELLHFADFLASEHLIEAITSFIAWDFNRLPVESIRKEYQIKSDFSLWEEESNLREISD